MINKDFILEFKKASKMLNESISQKDVLSFGEFYDHWKQNKDDLSLVLYEKAQKSALPMIYAQYLMISMIERMSQERMLKDFDHNQRLAS
jgi:hypothetical protein